MVKRTTKVMAALIAAIALGSGCKFNPNHISPDGVMVGRGVGGTDGTYLYISWQLPQIPTDPPESPDPPRAD